MRTPLSVIVSFLLTVWVQPLQYITPQAVFEYAYLSEGDGNSLNFHYVKAEYQPQAAGIVPFPIPNGWRAPYNALVSPDGHWIATFLSAQDDDPRRLALLYLFNPSSGAARSIQAGRLVGFEPLEGWNAAWSPNSRHLAVNLYSDDGANADMFLYSLDSDTITNITNDRGDQFSVAWAADSSHIVTVKDDCSDPLNASSCERALQIYNTTTLSLTSEVQIPIADLGPSDGLAVCNLKWSPDQRYVAFVSVCDPALSYFPKEVYLWDTTSNAVLPITSHTLAVAFQSSVINSTYQLAWLDAETLLVSAATQIGADPVSRETSLYDPIEQSTTQLVPDVFFQEVALNPVHRQLAFRALSNGMTSEANSHDVLPVQIALMDTYNSALAQLSIAATLNTSLAGCNLAWSPDGATLAYTTHTEGNCDAAVESIVFVDAATGAVQQHPIPADPNVVRIIPIGWVAAP